MSPAILGDDRAHSPPATAAMRNTVLYLFRHDLRTRDNPILGHLATSRDHGFTHLLPVYVFPANQVELSGFIKDGSKSPYPEARSRVGKYWRCGPYRAEFMGQAVWDVKESLEAVGSGLAIRLGSVEDAVRSLLEGFKAKGQKVGAVWMTGLEGPEERKDERDVAALCEQYGAQFKLWGDEKYLIDDRDIGITQPSELPDVFTTYRKTAEPLRERPRATLPTPTKGSLPPLPDAGSIPNQAAPFSTPTSLKDLVDSLVKPVKDFMPNIPAFPEEAKSVHPFKGGETAGQARLVDLIQSGGMKNYASTRNGLLGTEFSTKLSGYLAQGCITSRQIHHALVGYEDGTDQTFETADGFGAGENEGTKAVRFELLWRDYMRLCHQKFRAKLFRLSGFKGDEAYEDETKALKWKSPVEEQALADQDPKPEDIARILERFNAGTTGMGLIDASQRELLHTGYTSNRARQNVASFLAKHLEIDWRYGAEWYEMLLVDYDVSSNWGNWQYVAGVGNDPRSEIRIFNPVKQAMDYDKEGTYVRSWVPEVAKLEQLVNVFQAWTALPEELKAAGLEDNVMVTDPVKKIVYNVDGKPQKPGKRPFFRRRGLANRSGDGTANSEATSPTSNGGTAPAGETRLSPTGGCAARGGRRPPTQPSARPPQGPRGPIVANGTYGRGGGGRSPPGSQGGRGGGSFGNGLGGYYQGQQQPWGAYQGVRVGGPRGGGFALAGRGRGRGGIMSRPQQVDG